MWMKLFLPFFPLSSHPSDALKSGISNFSAKKSPFSWIIDSAIGIFLLLCKTNHSKRALLTFSYWQPCNFLVLGALSSSAWKNISLFLFQVEMVFLGTHNLSATSLFVMPFSMRARMSHFSFKVFLFSLCFVFFHLRSKFLFWFKFEFILKFEYVDVQDRDRKWFKGPEHLFDIVKSLR